MAEKSTPVDDLFLTGYYQIIEFRSVMELFQLVSFGDVPGLGKKIEIARRADKRSLVEICKLVGVSRETWYKLEGEEQAIALPMLRKIEEVLNVDFGVNVGAE